ncbi:MAG TPA: phytanoyl-CoA dioxygenase family protein [Pseudonocardiaceae bacterium]|nr:phytanoyl-CoA dioxygenase family protein [Pseudonocardiaceae bacterium]
MASFDAALLEQYHRDGFVLLSPDHLSGDVLGTVSAALPALLAESGPQVILERDGVTVRSVYGVHQSSQDILDVARHPGVLDPVRQLVRDDVYIHQSKVNIKAPLAGDRWEWHQDYIYWLENDGIARPDMINVAVFLDEVTEFNGPLTFIPGSHRRGVLAAVAADGMPVGYEDAPEWAATLTADEKFRISPQVIEELARSNGMVSPKGPAGSVLFFNPNLLHASSPNMSPIRRGMLIFVYNSVHNTAVGATTNRPAFLAEPDVSAVTNSARWDTIEIVVPNEVEYLFRDSTLRLSSADRDGLIQFNGSYESDHVVFWRSGPRVLLLPAGLDPLWFTDIHQALGLAQPPVVSPTPRSGLMLDDLFRDGTAQARLRDLVAGHRIVRLICHGATPDLYRLAEMVRGWGPEVEVEGVDERAYWSSLYLDNKVSMLDMAKHVPSVNVAPVMTVNSEVELRGAVDAMLALHGKVIVRSMLGYAGLGAAVTTADPERLAALYASIASDSFFAFPLVVQQFVEPPEGVGCPAADVLVDEHGAREIVPCAIDVSGGHSFEYVNVGPDALPPVWANRLATVSRDVAEVASRLGYRGWLSVDCVAGADDRLYVTEVNARRSGSLHAVGLLKLWEPGLTISAHFTIPVPPGLSYQDNVRPVFENLWASGIRAYPTTIRGLGWDEPVLAVVAAAPTAAEAEQIVEGIRKSLNS